MTILKSGIVPMCTLHVFDWQLGDEGEYGKHDGNPIPTRAERRWRGGRSMSKHR